MLVGGRDGETVGEVVQRSRARKRERWRERGGEKERRREGEGRKREGEGDRETREQNGMKHSVFYSGSFCKNFDLGLGF